MPQAKGGYVPGQEARECARRWMYENENTSSVMEFVEECASVIDAPPFPLNQHGLSHALGTVNTLSWCLLEGSYDEESVPVYKTSDPLTMTSWGFCTEKAKLLTFPLDENHDDKVFSGVTTNTVGVASILGLCIIAGLTVFAIVAAIHESYSEPPIPQRHRVKFKDVQENPPHLIRSLEEDDASLASASSSSEDDLDSE